MSEVIGILGGMGPMATVELQRLIIEMTPAGHDQGHLPMVVVNDPTIPDRSDAILGNGPSPLPAMVRAAEQLRDAGATFIACPCNSAHAFLPEVSKAVGMGYVDMITGGSMIARAAVSASRARGAFGERPSAPRPSVLVLGTRGMLASGLYQRALARAGIEAVAPTGKDQTWIDSEIRWCKSGAHERYRPPRIDVEAYQSDAVILACTELSGPPRPGHVDSLRVLAQGVVSRARGVLYGALPAEAFAHGR